MTLFVSGKGTGAEGHRKSASFSDYIPRIQYPRSRTCIFSIGRKVGGQIEALSIAISQPESGIGESHCWRM